MTNLTHIKVPLHLFSFLDLETAVILSFLYSYKKPFAWVCFDAWLGMSNQKISKKIKENSVFFVKGKYVTEDFRIITTYSLSEEGKKAYENLDYGL